MSFVQVGYDILNSTVDRVTRKILLQLGDAHGQTTDSHNVEQWQQYGLASRPSKPEGKDACQAVVLRTGDYDIAIATLDMRGLDLYGLLDHGEVCLYSGGLDGRAQGRVTIKKDGSINVYTTNDNTNGGEAVYLRTAPDGFSFVAPWGTLKFDETGFHVNHSSGAQLSLGGMYGLPGPLAEITSYVRMQAGTMTVNASAQSMGGEAGHNPLANSTAVKAAIAALQAEVVALGAAVAALQADPLHVASAVATAAAATVLTAQTTAIAAAVALVDTTSSST